MEILKVFYSPATAFAKLREKKAAWLLPMILMMVIGPIYMSVFLGKFSVEDILEQQIAASGKEVPPGATDQMVPFIRIWMYVAPVIFTPVMVLVSALVLFAIVKAFGGETRFSRMMNAAAFSLWPWSIVTTLFTTIMLFASPDIQTFNLNNPIPLNLGYFLEPDTVGAAFSTLLSSVNLINFYFIYLLGVGAAALSDRVKRSSVLGALLGIYAVIFLCRAGLAAIFG